MGKAQVTVQVPVTSPAQDWRQTDDGWWCLGDLRILRVDLQTGFVHIAAHCPYNVDLDLAWLVRLVHPECADPLRVSLWERWRRWLAELTQ